MKFEKDITLQDAIQLYEQKAVEHRKLFSNCPYPCNGLTDCPSLQDGKGMGCLKQADNYAKLANWLKELEELKGTVGIPDGKEPNKYPVEVRCQACDTCSGFQNGGCVRRNVTINERGFCTNFRYKVDAVNDTQNAVPAYDKVKFYERKELCDKYQIWLAQNSLPNMMENILAFLDSNYILKHDAINECINKGK